MTDIPQAQLETNIRRHMVSKFTGLEYRYIPERAMDEAVRITLKRHEQGNTLEEALEIGERVLEARIPGVD